MSEITIKTIAEHFQVSGATVSKALNDLPGVSDSLRKKIKDYAKSNNYVPNSFGKGLKGKTLKVIGVVISDNTNPIYSQNIQGIESEVEARGYNIFLCNTHEDWRAEERQVNALLQKAVDGIIVVPSDCDNRQYEERRFEILRQRQIPIVLLNRTLERQKQEFDYVKTDNKYGAYIATEHLIKKGHKRIAYITAHPNNSSTRDRQTGYLNACKEYLGRNAKNDIYYCDSMTYDEAYAETKKILTGNKNITAFFAANDTMAFGVLNAITECGFKVPDNYAVVGYDDNPYARISSIPLTTVRQEASYIGKRAAAVLIDKVEGTYRGLVQEVLKPVLIVRDST